MIKQRSKKKIGIVIVHYGKPEITYACLEAVAKTRKAAHAIFIYLVDNDPLHRLRVQSFPKHLSIFYYKSKTNRGFAAGVNLGVKMALKDGCRYILLLNNDAFIAEDFFQRLLPYFSKDMRVGMISPLIVYADNPVRIWCTSGYFNKTFLFTTYPYMNKTFHSVNLPEVIPSDFAAAAILIKSDVFRHVGFFDEKYFLFAEDVEWCFRAKQKGYLLWYVTKPLVLHKVSASSGVSGTNLLTPPSAYLYARNFFYIFTDHRDLFHIVPFLIGQCFIRLPFYCLLRSSSFATRVAYIRGLFAGIYYLIAKSFFMNSF